MKSRLFKYIFCLFSISVIIYLYLHNHQPYMEMSGETMNTFYNIRIRTNRENNLLHNAIKEKLKQINQEMSVFELSSEINHINNDTTGAWLELSPEMAEIMHQTYNIYHKSNGAFDPTIAPLIDLWGFGPSYRNQRIPEQAAIKETLKTTGFSNLQFSKNFHLLKKKHPEIKMNLSALAKGYAVEKIYELIKNIGYQHFVIEIGGEVKASGNRKIGDKGWNIAVVEPLSQNYDNNYVVKLKNMAVATSGDYRNFFYHKDKKYAHTISPYSGYPVEHNLASATVFHKNCTYADAYATALMVMGPKKGIQFANKNNLAVILYERNEDDTTKALISREAQKLLRNE